MAKLLNDASIETIATLDDMNYMICVDEDTGEITKIHISDVKTSLGVALVYAGLISQSSTSAPTIIETINTTGATFTPTRTGIGTYDLTCSTTLFGSGKVLCFFNNSTAAAVGAVRADTDTINIVTTADDILTLCSFKIEIYP